MKHTIFLMCLLCLLTTTTGLMAQQDNNWYFGRMAGLSFSSGKGVAITNSAMSTMEGSATISDENGNLLFYTNGIDVWNRQNTKMPHGTGLLGDQSTTQSAVIVPKPGSATRYYIFTADDAGGPNGLTYSEVDMTANNGLGDVVTANTRLITPITEKITAVYAANNKDVWVTVHQWGSNAFYSYKVTAHGVNKTPVISTTGMVIDGADNSGHYAGWMSISPNGKQLAVANGLLSVELFEYNTTTGAVSNAKVIKSPAKSYGVEFSPNSKLLYVTSENLLLQYDTTAQDIPSTQTIVGKIDVASSIKLTPNSKIFVVNKYLATSLSVIRKPNVPGVGCEFVLNTMDLGGKETFVGLPNFIVEPYYLFDIKADIDCTDTVVSFSAEGTMDADSIMWDFGDGNTSTNALVSHQYAQSGTYTVKAKAKNGKAVRYYFKEVTVVSAPKAFKPQNLVTCSDDSGNGVFNLKDINSQVLAKQPASEFTVSYYASSLDAESGINALNLDYTVAAGQHTIYAKVTRNGGICYAITNFTVTVIDSPVITMPDTYSFCQGSAVVLQAPAGFDSYTWSFDGIAVSGTNVKQVRKAGEYTLTVTRATGNIICTATKVIRVYESHDPVIKSVEVNDFNDTANSINVVMATEGYYEFSIDGTNWQETSLFQNVPAGHYEVMVKNGCGYDSQDVAVLMYPKFFTPNGDGYHDKWQIEHAWYAPDMVVTIYDRYGKTLTSFGSKTGSWDGTLNGYQLPATDYWFTATVRNGKEYKGHFSMMR